MYTADTLPRSSLAPPPAHRAITVCRAEREQIALAPLSPFVSSSPTSFADSFRREAGRQQIALNDQRAELQLVAALPTFARAD